MEQPVRADEEREFREFVAARIPELRRSAYLLCGNPHLADDLVSNALLRVYRKWRRVASAEQPTAYLRRVLVNVWIDEQRRPWRRERVVDTLPEPPPHLDADQADRPMLVALLRQLTPKRRAVLVLRFFEDLSVEQTAEVMSCSAGTVKTHTHRGLADLRVLMDRYGTPTELVRSH
jgi:RNA polymerase sigma-70 factor (sigma-E family)